MRNTIFAGAQAMGDNYDHIIIGGGLAGAALAYMLAAKGRMLWIDNGRPSCSAKAAGLMNPLTGRKLHKSWRAEQLFPFANQYYAEVEAATGQNFFHPLPLLRLYKSEDELPPLPAAPPEAAWEATTIHRQPAGEMIREEFPSAIKITGTAWLDTQAYIQAVRQYISRKGHTIVTAGEYLREPVGEEGVAVSTPEGGRQIHKADKYFFAEGWFAATNPLWSYLPWNPVKGEILTLRIPGLPQDAIFMRGVYIIPVGDETFRVGATYAWDPLDNLPTEEKANEILAGLKNLTGDMPYHVLRHEAAVRPATKPRRPFVGRHPQHHNFYILNGLGTKGVSLSPFFARQLINLAWNNEKPDAEVDIDRYSANYSGH